MTYVDVLWENLIPLVVICAISMVLTFAATAWTVRLVSGLMERRNRHE